MKTLPWIATAALLAAVAPLAVATPVACQGTCEVEGHSFGYRPPVLEIHSGADVLFTAIDIGHLTVEQNTLSSETACFAADANPSEDPDPVRFEIVGSGVAATTNAGSPWASSLPCTNAEMVAEGTFVLPFVCVFHPVLMKGALVVTSQ